MVWCVVFVVGWFAGLFVFVYFLVVLIAFCWGVICGLFLLRCVGFVYCAIGFVCCFASRLCLLSGLRVCWRFRVVGGGLIVCFWFVWAGGCVCLTAWYVG